MEKYKENFLDKIGIPHALAWGYLGVLIFMMGDGVEQGWLSKYLVDRGLSETESALVFTVYGITIGVSSWLSGVLSDMWGVRKTMFYGLIIYLIGVIGFVGIALAQFNFTLMLALYAVKGFGYPLFAYTFLVWIAKKSPQSMLGKAVGWFWFVFTGGLSVLGAIYASWATIAIGYIPTLWTAVLWALIGAVFALVFMKFKTGNEKEENSKKSTIKDLLNGLTIIKREPKVGIAGIIRTINTITLFGFPVFMPLYMQGQGFTEAEWLHIWAVAVGGNIIFNLIFGFVGDIIGWRKTVLWFGCVGCTITTLLFYYSPQILPNNITFVMVCGFLWGMTLAGYVPLSALVPSLVKVEKGAAMSILNLGAGLSAFVGPAIIGIVYSLGGSGSAIIWSFAILYVITAILSRFIALPEEAIGTPRQIRKMELERLSNS
ncbi:MFS transporter [Dysgonomonas sp. Marseille-P4677]|uniref:MFS transporter n=1 Tax=Dysgonomonas sp. Marseille-P4677 TaxID=2364790 RepID=UPI00191441F0|nr:MFS transporter [Dysgonomonas sp. Marseille-P4677]MBK5721906.1 MFS transporter [Dysgonomonas sp. Marseille-P4677]